MQPTTAKKALLLSTGLHLFILLILVASLEFSAPMPVVSNTDTKIVNAVALNDSPVLAPPTKAVEAKPPIQESASQKEEPVAKPAEAKPAPTEEAAKAPSPVAKLALPDESKKRLQESPSKIVKKEISKQLLAELENEIKKQALAKQKQIKNKFSSELKAQSEKTLQRFMKEQKQLAGQRSQHKQGVINKYKALILQAIGQQWVVPSHINKRLSCELLIRLAPGGVVMEVNIIRSSGDLLLDRSARAAVLKASPLPVPSDIYSFEPFQQFVLKVKPENVLENKDTLDFWSS
ncbi:MAG TPA: cell envelope integrity protein TolA [Gammaproteobacteria bacterium]|nr:cell envelope integrity protein TolA [Gammaproteobacteria bacterium]